MLRVGSRGDDVRELQTFLASEGYSIGSLDGIFGPKTKAAVRAFQKDQGIVVDGVVGPATQGKIDTFGEVTPTPAPAPAAGGGGTVLATIATNEDNYEQVRQQYLEATGFLAYVGEDFRLHFQASPASLKALQDVGTYTIYTAPGAALPPLNTDVTKGDDFEAPQEGLIPPEGAEGTRGIMSGGTLHRVKNDEGQLDFYVVAYEYPPGSGHSFYYRFEDLETLKASVGDSFGGIEIGDGIFEKDLKDWTDGGDSNEILGITGSFTGFINDLIREVASRAGIGDPTRLGKALTDPGIQLIMAKAAEGEWSDAQVKAALRNNDYYKNVLYPGIENFYGKTDNPEGAYALYKQNVTSNLETLGIPRDADGSYDSTMKDMLDAGISDTKFAAFTPTFLRAQSNDLYRLSINKWLAAAGMAPLGSFDSFFDLLEGTAPSEINEIVELAGLSFIASEQGFLVADNLLRDIAERTDLSESQISEMFLESDRDLLALGPAGLRVAGVSQKEIIATRAGFTTGNRTLVEMQNLISKVKKEQGIADDPTATIFTDFNREGAPIKKGLQVTISEGA